MKTRDEGLLTERHPVVSLSGVETLLWPTVLILIPPQTRIKGHKACEAEYIACSSSWVRRQGNNIQVGADMSKTYVRVKRGRLVKRRGLWKGICDSAQRSRFKEY